MVRKSIDIKFENSSNGDIIVCIYVDNKNENLSFGLCEFENEMDYLGFSTKLVEVEGVSGFLFDKNIDKNMLEREIKRFAQHYNII